MEAKISVDQMKKILTPMEKIKSVTYRASSGGITMARVETRKQEDIREELFLAFAESKTPLLTLKQNKSTLEEIFLELIQGGGRRVVKKRKERLPEKDNFEFIQGGEQDEGDI